MSAPFIQPLVSVLIANFNYDEFIGTAIESVLTQTYEHLDVVICDDGSTDDSWEIIRQKVIRDRRVTALRQENKGMASALNHAFAHARGDIVCLLDADDTFAPDKIESVVRRFTETPDAGLVVHAVQVVDRAGRSRYVLPYFCSFEEGDLRETLMRRGGRWRNVPCSALSLRRAVADQIFPIPAERFRSVADGFVFTLAPMLGPVAAISKPLATYRIHGANLTAAGRIDAATAQRQADAVSLIIDSVNERLCALGRMPIDPRRNLNVVEQQFVARLCSERTTLSLVRAYMSLSGRMVRDDLYHLGRKVLASVVYALCLITPVSRRPSLLTLALGPEGVRRHVGRLFGGANREIEHALKGRPSGSRAERRWRTRRKRYDWLVVGAGFTGAVIAERIATQLGQRVLVIDRRPHIGGNAYDEFDAFGVRVHRYGLHAFHTNSERVWQYLSQFTQWVGYEHRVQAFIDGRFVPLPVNLTTIECLHPARGRVLGQRLVSEYGMGARVSILKLRQSGDRELRALGELIYEKVFLGYTLKQWGLSPEELSPSVTNRVPVVVGGDDRYFQDRFQAMPRDGYTAMFRRMLDHPNIEVEVSTPYSAIREASVGRIVFTGPIDEFFDYTFGPLPYRSLRFEFLHFNVESYQPTAQVNFPTGEEYTRVLEFRKIPLQVAPIGSTVAIEYPRPHVTGETEPYYPVLHEEYRAQYERYVALANEVNGKVVFAGRLADYRYYNMDQAVGRALAVFEREIAPVPVV